MSSGSDLIPKPSPNGGLYTGAPASPPGAPWGAHPVAPDAGYYNFGSLRGTSAPPAAMYMVPGGGLRPGNNTPLLPAEYIKGRVEPLNAICVPTSAYSSSGTSSDARNQTSFRQYTYL